VENFKLFNIKSFRDSGTIDLKPITILLGKNSSGKSSLIRFPIVLKQTLQERISPLLFYGKLLDYGDFDDVVFNHIEEDNIGFQITIDIRKLNFISRRMYVPSLYRKTKLGRIFDDSKKGEKINVKVEIGRKLHNDKFWGELEVKNFNVSFNTKSILTINKNKKKKYNISYFNRDFSNTEVHFLGFFPNIEFERGTVGDNDPKSNDLSELRLLTKSIERYLVEIMDNISYIGPFRRTPERNIRFQEASLLTIGADGEYTSELLASYYRKNDIKFFEDLNKWLEKHLNIHITVEELKGGMYRIIVKDLETGASNNIRDVGFGLSQVLPIIVQVLMSQQSDTFPRKPTSYNKFFDKIRIFEQPELHLHPSAQSNLADLFIMGHKIDKRNLFLIETHSEHLILRLRRRILEGEISPDDVAIYLVEKNTESQEGSFVKKLSLDHSGEIKDWPSDFFDQDFKEMIEIKKLNQKKKGEFEW
jgi:predicted ATPase